MHILLFSISFVIIYLRKETPYFMLSLATLLFTVNWVWVYFEIQKSTIKRKKDWVRRMIIFPAPTPLMFTLKHL